jgi:hypothetical protein
VDITHINDKMNNTFPSIKEVLKAAAMIPDKHE